MNNIIVISYKPDYVDPCVGCVRDRFRGEFEINQGTPEELIPIMVRLDFSRKSGDVSYGHTFIINGFVFGDEGLSYPGSIKYEKFGDEGKFYPDSVKYRKAEDIFKDINNRYNDAVTIKKEEEKRKSDEKKKQDELRLLKSLKEKYEN